GKKIVLSLLILTFLVSGNNVLATEEEAGKMFYSELQKKAMEAVESILHVKLYPIEYPSQGDFFWNYLNANQVFNESTFNYISARVYPSKNIPGTAKLSSPGGFPNAYSEVLNNMEYVLSSGNQQKLQDKQTEATVQAQAIISDYQTTFGTITEDDMKSAGVKTKQDFVISYILGSQWSGRGDNEPLTYTEMADARNLKKLLPKMPASGDQVVTDVSIYLSKMSSVNALSDKIQNGVWIIAQLKNNSQDPTKNNGGIKTFNPVDGSVSEGFQVGYKINSAISTITNDLKNTGRIISLGMKTHQASGNQISVSIDGQAGFSIGSWLRFSTSASMTYDMSRAQGTSTDCSVTIKWEGYSIVPVATEAWQQATNRGWYYGDPIAQAIKNQGKDVDGFKFLSTPPYNMAEFENGGNFGMLDNLLIANYPTIEITYTNANFSSFKQAWSEKVSGNLTLFGFIKLGSFSQGAYGSSYSEGADNSTFTVKFSASPEVTSVPQNQKTAYVIGGTVVNPEGTTD
ncbi:MAG: hypothetical protein KAT34_00455, partial [Candidatus Aminicenantes bacterium]|nr:hypothetical protein [Candidatus Aminicenantes bacterium]